MTNQMYQKMTETNTTFANWLLGFEDLKTGTSNWGNLPSSGVIMRISDVLFAEVNSNRAFYF
ncbi:hypothetical protein DT065_16875 [Salicibibacter kimchii]|uniref:Uncharacterized protein n=1 Tax=Salicibibacter kimchii TaxID=2099786 RepID=A0A345C2R2_9BACI|nr:hypothetical protein DT065_16875 [Salicibibacter kimchii]